MKKLFTFLASITLSVMLFAQAPQSFSYQTVIRDASWTVLNNQSVGIKISILEDVATGTVVYEEYHSTTTSQIGLVNLSVGDGAVMTGVFNTIDWGNHTYFIEVAVDVTGGSNYIVMGTTQLRSVPYSLYAETSGTPGLQGPPGIDGTNGIDGIDGADCILDYDSLQNILNVDSIFIANVVTTLGSSSSNSSFMPSSEFPQNIYSGDLIIKQEHIPTNPINGTFSYVVPSGKNIYLKNVQPTSLGIDLYRNNIHLPLQGYDNSNTIQGPFNTLATSLVMAEGYLLESIILTEGDSLHIWTDPSGVTAGSSGDIKMVGYMVDIDSSVVPVLENVNPFYTVPANSKLIVKQQIFQHLIDINITLPNGGGVFSSTGTGVNGIDGFLTQFLYIPAGTTIESVFNPNTLPTQNPHMYISGYLIND